MTCNQTPFFPTGTYRPICFEANGVQADFSFDFPYIGQESWDGANSPYIEVRTFDASLGILTVISSSGWTMPDSTSVRLAVAPDAGLEVWILRDSSVNGRLVNYASGQTVSESNLDLDSTQHYYLWEESVANGELTAAQADDKNYFGLEFEFSGDGTTMAFRLEDGDESVEIELSRLSLWAFVNGVFAQSDDYSVSLDVDGVAVITFDEAPSDGSDILVRVAQQNSLAVMLDDDSVDTDKLQDCSVTFPKLCLDGVGSDKQVAAWVDPGQVFGPADLTPAWINGFNDAVILNPLDQFTPPLTSLDLNGQKITNLAVGTAANDAATVGQIPTADSSARFDINWDSNPGGTFTIVTGLPNGIYFCNFRVEMGGASNSASYIAEFNVNGVPYFQRISNHPDGNTIGVFPAIVSVADGTISCTLTNRIRTLQGAVGYRIASS